MEMGSAEKAVLARILLQHAREETLRFRSSYMVRMSFRVIMKNKGVSLVEIR